MSAVRALMPGRLSLLLSVAAGLAVTAALAGTGGASAAASSGGIITTIAGGTGGPGAGPAVSLSAPCGVAYGTGGVYVADGQSVREVSQGGGALTTAAGTGVSFPIGDHGPATAAGLSQVCGVTVDHNGNLVIADAGHERVRVMAASSGTFYGQPMVAGDIYTVAGIGTQGYAGDGGAATEAELYGPSGVAVDGHGNLIIADTGNNRIRVVAPHSGTFYGQAMTAGHIYTVAGDHGLGDRGDGGPATEAELNLPRGAAVDGAGNLVIADTGNNQIRVVAASTGEFYGQAMTAGDIYTVAGNGTYGYAGDHGPATAAEFGSPDGVTVDRHGNLIIADTGNDRIRVVAASTGEFYGQAMTAGDVYTVAGNGTYGYAGDGGPAAAAEFGTPGAVSVDGDGDLVIADTGNDRVRVVAAKTGRFYGQQLTAGDVYTVAGNGQYAYCGDGGAASRAEFDSPGSLALDRAGNVLIADTGNSVIRVKAASTGSFYGQAMVVGHVYTIAGNGTPGYAGDGGPATEAEFYQPFGVAVDAAGNVLIVDAGNNRIRVLAATTGTFYGQAMTAGDIYTIAGNGIGAFSGDGGPATKAEINDPFGVALDAAGNVLIADQGNNRIRVLAATTGTFYGQAMTAGDIYTVAGTGTRGNTGDGGPATSAELNAPYGVTTDSAGNLVIADTVNYEIRVVAATTGTFYGQAMTAGDIYTVAGTGTQGFAGDGGPATQAMFDSPEGVAVDSAGNLVIADTLNSRIRVVAEQTGTFYGQAMTASDIYTIAGNGIEGFGGDGGPAASASLYYPGGLAVTKAGDLIIADTMDNRIREVTR
jgi:secreted PhoX family phosphatase